MANTSDLAKGVVLNLNNDLWIVVDKQFVSPGKGSAFYRVKLKSMSSGKVVENTFKSGESIDVVHVQNQGMQYLYKEGENYALMNMESYEQILVNADVMNDVAPYLKEGLDVVAKIYEDRVVAVEIPKKITYEVVEADDAVKGDTVSGNVTKAVKLENGLSVQVPIFIKQGEKIIINTETGQYVERA